MKAFLVSCLFLLVASLAPAQEPAPAPAAAPDANAFPLWPDGKMPGKGADKPESSTSYMLSNVSVPTLTLFKAPGVTGPTPVVVVCPGGGYGGLVINREGTEIAAWLNSLGLTAVVLKYRVPQNQDGAFQDIERAVRLVRSHADDWSIDPKRTGVIGFSAGGHLCARLDSNFATAAYPPTDAVDTLSCRPDFAILVYPAYLEKADHPYESNEHLGVLADEIPIGPDIPPTFLVHSEDDPKFVGGTKLYHAALDSAHLANEFALYPTGGHGYGIRSTGEAKAWPEACKAWLQKNGILPAP